MQAVVRKGRDAILLVPPDPQAAQLARRMLITPTRYLVKLSFIVLFAIKRSERSQRDERKREILILVIGP